MKHCIGVANGLDARKLIVKAYCIDPGDEATCLINPVLIEAAITSKTKAIMVVHLYGRACEMDTINAIAEKHHLVVLEGCVQAHGVCFGGNRVGNLGNAAGFSFYPRKNLGCLGDSDAVTESVPAASGHPKLVDDEYVRNGVVEIFMEVEPLADRIPTLGRMAAEASVWETGRNSKGAKVKWQFTTDDARQKLKRLYPTF